MKFIFQALATLIFLFYSQISMTKTDLFPEISLPQRVNGEQAIQALGNRLPAVASIYNMSTAEFAKTLRTDSSAWIGKKGRLLFIDEFPEPTSEESETSTSSAPFELNQTFKLHSKTGALRVIYLDFDGHITSGTAWNNSSGVDPIISPAYSIDSDSSSFSASELENIQNIWRQVAEDFSPFNIDVTTEEPGSDAIIRNDNNDDSYGTRVVFTNDTFDDCGCGGFAYVGVFNYPGSYYKPAFVFNTSLVGAGEAASHEAGHNLGLSHDGQNGGSNYYQGHGSGATGWAPIMGVGYNKALVQWSKGEYLNANQQQDDINLIQQYGVPLKIDDHGDTSSNATLLSTTSDGQTATLSGYGIISERTDFDSFSFVSGSGPYSISAQPANFSPNLDILLELYNSSDELVANANPLDSLSATISGENLPTGDYYLRVSGVGKGDPQLDGYSDYGSLGEYFINGTVTDSGGLLAPIANIIAPYSPSTAPLTIFFDGTSSSDQDGNIVSYNWTFGDGSSASGETVTYTYNTSGSFVANLTVIDNDSLSHSDNFTVDIINLPPTAELSINNNTSGVAPHTINFSGNTSFDIDGSIIGYLWHFGDGNSSSMINPSHDYNTAGTFNATLTVTDNLGASHTAYSSTISITPPDFVEQYAHSEVLSAGSVTGDFSDTLINDGTVQSITERESGGRKSNRYSYLEHTWLFNVQTGSNITFYVNAWLSTTTEAEQMLFEYSTDNVNYNSLTSIDSNQDNGFQSSPLSITSSGQVYVRVTDTDNTPGNRVLDTIFIDHIYIRTDNQETSTPPDMPINLTAFSMSTSQLNLEWTDSSVNELGFTIEKSDDNGASWHVVANMPANTEQYASTDLQENSSYGYRVSAFNDAGASEYIEVFATTQAASNAVLTGTGSKAKGVKYIDLEWTQFTNVHIYLGTTQLESLSGSAFTHNTQEKGGGSYVYKVCQQANANNCSNELTITF